MWFCLHFTYYLLVRPMGPSLQGYRSQLLQRCHPACGHWKTSRLSPFLAYNFNRDVISSAALETLHGTLTKCSRKLSVAGESTPTFCFFPLCTTFLISNNSKNNKRGLRKRSRPQRPLARALVQAKVANLLLNNHILGHNLRRCTLCTCSPNFSDPHGIPTSVERLLSGIFSAEIIGISVENSSATEIDQ